MADREVGILIKVSKEEKEQITQRAKENGFASISEFIRIMTLKGKLEIK